MEAKRLEIATLIRAGHSNKDIVKFLNVDRHTVYRVRKRVEEGKSLKDRPRSGRPVKLTPEDAKLAFKAEPTMSMADFAKKKGMARSTVSNAINAAGGKSKKYEERPLLTKHHQELRVERGQCILNDLKHHGNRVIFFSDEKTFTVDPVINKQNDCIICFEDTPSEARHISKTKHPASVMMLGVVASTGDKMPPIWFSTGYRLNAADYLVILQTKILP